MGRNKIKIERIHNERTRLATFNKRKNGLVKKAMELSILCGCEVALIVIGNNRLTQYSSSDMDQLLLRYTDGGFDEPQAEPLTNEDYPKLFSKKGNKSPPGGVHNNNGKEGPLAKRPRPDSPTSMPFASTVSPALAAKPLAAAPLEGRGSPVLPAQRAPAVTNNGSSSRPVSPPGSSAHRAVASSAVPRQQSATPSYPTTGAAAAYVGYPSTRSAQFAPVPSQPSLYSVPAVPIGRASSPQGGRYSSASASPNLDTPSSPHSNSNPTTPPGNGHQQHHEDRRVGGGRHLQEQQFSQKLNKKNLSLAIPDVQSTAFPGSSSAHSRHANYTPGFTALTLPSAGMPFIGDSEMHTGSVLPSPSIFLADTPGSHHEHGQYMPHWAWNSPRSAHDAMPQERFLSRDMNLAMQEGTLHQQLGKRKADMLKV